MMKIDGIDITTIFGGRIQFLEYTLPPPSYNRFITTTDVDRKIPNKRVSVGVRDIKVRIAFHDTKENSYIMSSALTSILSDALVNFGGGITYKVVISNSGDLNFKTDKLFEWELYLQMLEKYGEEVIVESTTTAAPIEVFNFGTYKTPIIIEITPKNSSVTAVSVKGMLGYHSTIPLTVNNTSLNKKIIIDGDSVKVVEVNGSTETNKFLDTNIVSFPEIGPAQTTALTFTPSADIEVKISFKPRYI